MARNAELTRLLNEWRIGDPELLAQIVPEVYDELHRVARSCMRGQPAHHTLQATALVNEAFCRLDGVKNEIKDRGHFIGIVANLMRQILVDHARAKHSQKRGGDAHKVSIDDVAVGIEGPSVDVMALESVLKSLEKNKPRLVRIAELYYFCGTTYAQTAEVLDISEATLHRDLKLLRALLAQRLASDDN